MNEINRSLNMNDGWEDLVNTNADRVSFEMEDQERMEDMRNYKRQQEAKGRRTVYGVLIGLLLVLIGCFGLNHIQIIPAWITLAIVQIGMIVYSFTFGWFAGSGRKGR